jgi:hypothetical protein
MHGPLKKKRNMGINTKKKLNNSTSVQQQVKLRERKRGAIKNKIETNKKQKEEIPIMKKTLDWEYGKLK